MVHLTDTPAAAAPARREPLRARGRALARLLPVLLPCALFFSTGLRGLDFGEHWDEATYLVQALKSRQQGDLLPGDYRHPSMTYWLALAVPPPASLVHATQSDPETRRRASAAYLMRTREVFLGATMLAIVWVYLLVLRWRGGILEALLAASFLASSWEVAYHARWITPDGIMMQLGALSMLGVALAALEPMSRAWLWLGAAAAGLTCGTKYPCGLLLVPALIVAARAPGASPLARKRVGAVLLIFGWAYLLSTPGTVLDARAFVEGLRFELDVYGRGDITHTVAAGWDHLGRILLYLSCALFSRHAWLSLPIFILALLGAAAVYRESRFLFAVLLSFPLLYLAYFGLTIRLMLVRNLLVLVPFLAVLAARGAASMLSIARLGRLKWALGVAVLAAVLANARFLIYAAGTIRDRRTDRFVRELVAEVDARKDLRFWVSPSVARAIGAFDARPRENVLAGSAQGAAMAVFTGADGFEGKLWPVNTPFLYPRWFGPFELNPNYYANWPGDDRMFVMPVESARALGVRGVSP